MTVKEFIEVLEACNPDAKVEVLMWDGHEKLKDEQVFAYEDVVVLDTTYTSKVQIEKVPLG